MQWTHQTPLAIALLFTGAINALPVIGVLSGERLQSLYGIAFDDAGLRVLMRHRAVLFGLLGGAMMAAAFMPHWRTPLAVAGLISMLSFVLLAQLESSASMAIQRVVRVDVIAIAALAAALGWSLVHSPQPSI